MSAGVQYTLGLASDAAVAGVKAFQGALGSLQSTVTKAGAALGLLGVSFAAFKSAEGFAEQLKGIFEAGKELRTTSIITGQSIRDLVTLRKAFSESGLGADEAQGSLIRMQKALGGVNDEGQPTGKIFQQLRLNINALKGESGVQQISQIGTAIMRLRTQSDRAAATMQIFGREGASMLALFADAHAIGDAQRGMAAYGAVMQRNAGLFKQITNTLEALHGRVKGFFVGFADAVGPVLLPLLERLKNSLNLVGFGERIGKAVGTAAQAIYGLFQNGDLGEAAGLALKVGFSDAVHFLQAEWGKVTADFEKSGPSIMQGMEKALEGLKELFLGLATILSGAISKGIADGMRVIANSRLGKLIGITPEALNAQEAMGEAMQTGGAARAQGGISDLSGMGGLAGQFGKFSQALLTPMDQARGKLDGILAKADATAKKALGAMPGELPAGAVGTGSLGSQSLAAAKIEPLGDRLSKIGGFVGGAGGVKGQRAQEDTARNTSRLVELQAKAVAVWEHWKQQDEGGEWRY